MKNRIIKTVILFSILIVGTCFAENKIGPPYNVRIITFGDGTTFWEEERLVEIEKGLNQLEFLEVPTTVDNASIVIKSLSKPTNFKVVETSFLPVSVQAKEDPKTDKLPSAMAQEEHSARILAVVLADKSGCYKCKLFYKVNGLPAVPRYIAFLDSDKQGTMDLKGMLNINNTSGIGINETAVYFPVETTSLVEWTSTIHRGNNIDTALYLVPTPVSMENGKTRNFEFISLSDVPFNKFNLYDGLAMNVSSFTIINDYERSRRNRNYSVQKANSTCVKVIYELDLSRMRFPENGLPLTNVQVFKLGDRRFLFEKGLLQFNKSNNRYQIITGTASGLSATREQVNFKDIVPGESCEETIKISIQNNTSKIQEVRVHEHLSRSSTYKVEKCDKDYLEIESGILCFQLEIKPLGSSAVTYTVRYEY